MTIWDNDNIENIMNQHSIEELTDMVNKRRGTGKTLGTCMGFISKAMAVPGSPVEIYDLDVPTRQAMRIVVIPTLEYIIKQLGLNGLVIDADNLKLTYNLPKNLLILKKMIAKVSPK